MGKSIEVVGRSGCVSRQLLIVESVLTFHSLSVLILCDASCRAALHCTLLRLLSHTYAHQSIDPSATRSINLSISQSSLQVEDWQERHDDTNPYEVERIATYLAVTCMFLAGLYSIFAVLLFLYFGSDEDDADEDDRIAKPLASITNDPRRENFITMG
jgi:hypothetical protein